MDDRFLHEHRRDPDPGFERDLRRRLAATQPEPGRPAFRLAPALAGAAAVVVVAALFTLPSVRAQAQALLDLFRVRQFVAVEFEPERLESLKSLRENPEQMVFDRREVLQEPGEPVEVGSAAAAAGAVGYPVVSPAVLPGGLALESVHTQGEGRARMAVNAAALRTVLETLDLRDVEVPMELDGRWIEVRTAPSVTQRFANGERHAVLLQAPSPEVSLPPGADLARLGEIGLRVLGLEPAEARHLAATIDWRSTMVVPVPANAGAFRDVTVRGRKGLLVTMVRASSRGDAKREGSVLMWTEDDRVHALTGNVAAGDLMQMAESLR